MGGTTTIVGGQILPTISVTPMHGYHLLELHTQYNNKEVLFSQKVTPQKDFVFALCVAECSVLQCEVEKTQGRKYVVYVPKKFVTSVGYIHTCVVLAYEHNTQELN